MKLGLFLILAISLNAVRADKFAFNDFKLIKIQPQTELHLETISQWENNDDFDLWSRVKKTKEPVTVLLSPEAFSKYKVYMAMIEMPFEIVQDDAEKMFQEQEQSMKQSTGSSIVGKYARYDEIQSYLTDTVAKNSDIASSYIAGSTYENRNLRVLVLKTATSKKNVWIDCGIHAREWVSPSTCIWMINQLIQDYRASPATSVLNKYEIHVLPLLNPDGYEYSHTSFRMWRKNRSRNAGSSCLGTDLNRNYGFKWYTGGSSNNPCSDTFAGSEADSELETKAVESAILKHQGRWAAFFTIHSYGLWWFTNWGYTRELPPNYDDTVAKAQVGVNAIKKVNGLSFLLGSSARILYVASGGSEDWAYGVAQVPYTYCLELRPGQSGVDSNYGFALPQDRAPKAGAETYAGIKAYLENL